MTITLERLLRIGWLTALRLLYTFRTTTLLLRCYAVTSQRSALCCSKITGSEYHLRTPLKQQSNRAAGYH